MREFRALDREAEIQISERHLPHWFQPGVAVFVTFRTADSMPASVIARWRDELGEWLKRESLLHESSLYCFRKWSLGRKFPKSQLPAGAY